MQRSIGGAIRSGRGGVGTGWGLARRVFRVGLSVRWGRFIAKGPGQQRPCRCLSSGDRPGNFFMDWRGRFPAAARCQRQSMIGGAGLADWPQEIRPDWWGGTLVRRSGHLSSARGIGESQEQETARHGSVCMWKARERGCAMRFRVQSYGLVAILCFGAALSVSFHTSVGKEQERSDVSVGWMNGRWWKGIDEGQRVAYVTGFEDGVRAFHTSLAEATRNHQDVQDQVSELAVTSPHVELTDITSEISLFYEDAANIRIPASEALLFALMKFKGKDQRTLDDFVAKLRRGYNK
jgi:hypothetical protein